MLIDFLPVVVLFVFMYHYERNGNPLNLGDFVERVFWAASFTAGYAILAQETCGWWIAVYYFVSSFVAIIAIPHAFAQNMGRRIQTWKEMPPTTFMGIFTAPKWWPGFLFLWVKNFYAQDFLGMMSVGLIRGALVFLPAYWLGAAWPGAIAAAAITMLWQPCAYWLGYKVPFTIWDNPAHTSAWGEFFIGIGWAAALTASIVLV